MGKGKGSTEYWACRVKPGRIMFEIDGVNATDAKKAMSLAAAADMSVVATRGTSPAAAAGDT